MFVEDLTENKLRFYLSCYDYFDLDFKAKFSFFTHFAEVFILEVLIKEPFAIIFSV